MPQQFARIEKDFYHPKHRRFNKTTDRRWRVVYPNPTTLGIKKESFRTEEAALERLEFLNFASPLQLTFDGWRLADAIALWEEKRLSRQRSYSRELSKLRLLRSELGDIPLPHLSEEHIVRLKLFLVQRYSARTVNAYLVTLRTILNYVKRKGCVQAFPDISEHIEKSLEEKRDRVLTREEFDRLISACHVKRYGRDRCHLIPYLIWLHETGCRTGELAQIRNRDVDVERGIVRIWSGKSKRPVQRECGLTPRLLEEIGNSESSKNPNDFIFGNQVEWKRSFKTACRIAKIENFRFHDLRRTAITNMLENGIPLHLVAKMVGHSANSVLTLDVYTRFRADYIKDMMSLMGPRAKATPLTKPLY